MKKLFFISIAIVAFATAVFTQNNVNDNTNLSATQLANIDALTRDESSGGHSVACYCKINLFSSNVCTAMGSGAYCGGDPCDSHDGNCR